MDNYLTVSGLLKDTQDRQMGTLQQPRHSEMIVHGGGWVNVYPGVYVYVRPRTLFVVHTQGFRAVQAKRVPCPPSRAIASKWQGTRLAQA